jgi:hypothetical protein
MASATPLGNPGPSYNALMFRPITARLRFISLNLRNTTVGYGFHFQQ